MATLLELDKMQQRLCIVTGCKFKTPWREIKPEEQVRRTVFEYLNELKMKMLQQKPFHSHDQSNSVFFSLRPLRFYTLKI